MNYLGANMKLIVECSQKLVRLGENLWDKEQKLDKVEPLDVPTMTTDFVKEHGLPCPEEYVFKDENGNIINATKIVLEKKKKEYPKTFEACVNVLGMTYHDIVEIRGDDIPKKYGNVLDCLYKLLICRDAYWKIAGDWKPEFGGEPYYYIDVANYKVNKGVINGLTNCTRNMILVFPKYEMRDAFYENFKKEIEICKELL
jgi:hypothetical protein